MMVIAICVSSVNLTSIAHADSVATPTVSATTFPVGEILVVLADDNAKILKEPQSDPALTEIYRQAGTPEVVQAFSQVGLTQDDADIQFERILQKYRGRQKLRQFKLPRPIAPALHRFYILTFKGSLTSDATIITGLKKSTHIKAAMPNLIVKIMAEPQSVYYVKTLAWAKPYLSDLGVPPLYGQFADFIGAAWAQKGIALLNTDLAPKRITYDTTQKISGMFQFPGRPPFVKTSCQVTPPLKHSVCQDGELLVRFKDGVTDAQIADVHKSLKMTELHKYKMTKVRRIKLPPGMGVEQALEKFAARSDVLYAEPNYKRYPDRTPNDPDYPPEWVYQWAFENKGYTGTAGADINAEGAWDYTTGSAISNEIIVAVIDTGLECDDDDFHKSGVFGCTNYSDFTDSNIWINEKEWEKYSVLVVDGTDDDGNGYTDDYWGYDFSCSDKNGVYCAPDDEDGNGVDGHGTMVSSIIGARGNNSTALTGVVWSGLKIMALKAGDSSLDYSAIYEAIDYAASNGANIVNMSYGAYTYTQAEKDAIDSYPSMLFVTSAGNDGIDNDSTPHYPSSYTSDNIIAVAATDSSDDLADFGSGYSSNYGLTSVDLGAPGKDIWVAGLNDVYSTLDGTSLAAPFVSGAAALLMNYFDGDPTDFKEVLINSATTTKTMTTADYKTVSGKRLDIEAAFALAETELNKHNDSEKTEECDEECKMAYDTDGDGIADSESCGCFDNPFGCFIATAAYGSYLDPHVAVLRHFRDTVLLNHDLGRALVDFYYRNSPSVAAIIEKHDSLRFVTRMALTPVIYAVEYPMAAFFVVALIGVIVILLRVRRHA